MSGARSILTRPLAELPDPLEIEPIPGVFDLAVTPPGSKSETNRAIVLAALASGTTVLRGALTDADDSVVAIEAVRTLGAKVDVDRSTLRIEGVGGRWKCPAEGVTVDLKNAGTATRFLSAAAMLAPGPVTITGNERMQQRPIGELADALHQLGATIEWHGTEGCPPLTIIPPSGGVPGA